MRRSKSGGGRGKARQQPSSRQKRPRQQRTDDDEIDSAEDSGDEELAQHAQMLEQEDAAENAEAAETAAERRVRLAKEMIDAMDNAAARRSKENEFAGPSGVARGANEADAVADALEEDALRRARQYRNRVAASLRGVTIRPADVRCLRGPRLSATCVAVAPDESFVVCGCKDGALVKWALPGGQSTKLKGGRGDAYHGGDAESGADGGEASGASVGQSVGGWQRRQRPKPARDAFTASPTGHLSDVLAVAISPDGSLIASGGRDGMLLLWDARTERVVHQFRGHRGAVQALACRRDALADEPAPQLFSGSRDRTARIWDLEQRGYIDTLYGHQEAITAVDALCDQLALSAAEDRSVRLWNVAEETQLCFAGGHKAQVDACAMMHAEAFASGGQDGRLTLWSSRRKKALCSVDGAHGVAPWGGKCWLSALTAPAYGDVIVSGSCDGAVRFWEADEANKQLVPLFEAPVTGFVNGLALAPSGKFLACAVGQEHRLGRWFKVPEARNALQLVALPEAMHTKPNLAARAAADLTRERLQRRAQRTPAEQQEEDEEEAGGGDDDDFAHY